MTFNLRLSRARTGVVAMRQDSSYYNNWIPRNWGEKGVIFFFTNIYIKKKQLDSVTSALSKASSELLPSDCGTPNNESVAGHLKRHYLKHLFRSPCSPCYTTCVHSGVNTLVSLPAPAAWTAGWLAGWLAGSTVAYLVSEIRHPEPCGLITDRALRTQGSSTCGERN